MSKKANPVLVGSFVLGALGLIIAAIIILGNIKLKDNRLRCIAYFTGSLYGLDIGAPVTFRGVAIGRVSQIRILYDDAQKNYAIPVYIDIEQTPLDSDLGTSWEQDSVRKVMGQLIENGLRAQLKISSLLTSKLYIDLAFQPGTMLRLRHKDDKLFEIPTLPSGLEQITQKLEKLPLDEILIKTASALDGINSIINSEETRRALKSLDSTLNRLDILLGDMDEHIPGVLNELKSGLTNIATLSATATTVLKTTDKEIPVISNELQKLLVSLDKAAGSAVKSLNNLDQLTANDSNFSFQVIASLREIEKAAVSIKQLTDYLQQYPNALVFGQEDDKR